MNNRETVVKDLEIVIAILNRMSAETGKSDDIDYARKVLKGVIGYLKATWEAEEAFEKGKESVMANGDVNSTTGNPDMDSKTTAFNKKSSGDDAILPCGRKVGEHSGCPFLSPNGACTQTVLTSNPPQYNMCPARGTGYIECSKA